VSETEPLAEERLPAGEAPGGGAPEEGRAGATLRYLVRELADRPEDVHVATQREPGSARFTVRVGPGDMGRVIGRRGRTAQAIRTIVRVAGAREGVETAVEFEDR